MNLEDLNKDLATKQLAGFWASNITDNDGEVLEPRTTVVLYLWKWDDIYNGLLQAGELVSLEQSERRTIRLINPGVPGTTGATNTVHTSIQLVKPGEIAKAHRHTLTALRFVLRGGGAFTTVEGERFTMNPGDLILTPQWTWHDHYNGTGENIMWLDGHDGPCSRPWRSWRWSPSARNSNRWRPCPTSACTSSAGRDPRSSSRSFRTRPSATRGRPPTNR